MYYSDRTHRLLRWTVVGAPAIIVFILLFVTGCTVYTAFKLPMPAFDEPIKVVYSDNNDVRGYVINNLGYHAIQTSH